VNNPAGFILAHLDQLRARIGSRDEGSLRALDDCIDGVRRIHAIVTALHTLTRDDAAAPQRVLLENVVETALLVGMPSVPRGIEIERRLEPIESFESRPGTLMRIVLDLVGHAADCIPPSESGRVVVSTHREGDLAVIDVRDDRGPETVTPENEGRVLRIEMVRQSVRVLGGALSISTRAFDGLTRTVRLPIAATRESTPEPARTDAKPSTRRATVLVIEDEPALLRVLSRVIGRTHDVLQARNGDVARSLVDAHGSTIDLVLCDVILADTNGLELRDALAERAPRLANRFAFMTGGGLNAEIEQQLVRTGCPVVGKPLEPDDLMAFIASRVTEAG
jgi:CheY-like chemotaxis protein